MPFQRRKKPDSPPLTPDEALSRLEHFCAYRERSPKEVRQKIAELGQRDEIAGQLFDTLQADGFFNEERFATAFAGGKFRGNHWGRVRIRLELQVTHGIAPAVIEAALDSIPEAEYLAVLERLMDRKRAQLPNAEAGDARQKIAASLIRAGFEPELVFGRL